MAPRWLYGLTLFVAVILFAQRRTFHSGETIDAFSDSDSTTTFLENLEPPDPNSKDTSDLSSVSCKCPTPVCPTCPACSASEPSPARPPLACPSRKKAREPRREPTSWYFCLNKGRGAEETRCFFQNVCVAPNATILFFGGKKPDFSKFQPTPLFYFDKYGKAPGNPIVIKDNVPENVKWYPGTTAFWQSYMPVNFGHALSDNFFNIYRLLRIFGLEWDEDVSFLTQDHRTCKERASIGFDENDSHCVHLQELGTFFGKGTWSARKPNPDYTTQYNGFPIYCTRQLVAGTSKFGMGFDLELAHDAFVEHILCRLGLDPRPPLPNPPRIAVFEKKGRRRTLNVPEIAKGIKDRFGIEADVLDIANYSFPDQVKMMQHYSHVVTPSGGVSFTAQFLPPGGGVIYTQAWDLSKNRPIPMDVHLWSTRLRVRDFYYPLEFEDLEENPTLSRTNLSREAIYRDFVDIRVDLPRMLEAVERALKPRPF